jgi:hypothetical protein
MKKSSILIICAGIVINPWALSILCPEDGFYVFGLLEKSNQAWGLASTLFVIAIQTALIAVGLLGLEFAAEPRKAAFANTTLQQDGASCDFERRFSHRPQYNEQMGIER